MFWEADFDCLLMVDRSFFCNNKSKNAFCFVFGQGSFCLALHLCSFFWKSFSDYPTPFFIAGFSFLFWQKNIFLSLAYALMKLMYLWLVSFLLWLLAFLYVMLNLFQHLTASLYLLPLLGEILNLIQDDIVHGVMLNLFNVVQFAHARHSSSSLTLLSLNRKFQHLVASLFLSFSADRSWTKFRMTWCLDSEWRLGGFDLCIV